MNEPTEIVEGLSSTKQAAALAGLTFRDFAAVNLSRCEGPAGFGHLIREWTLSDWFTAAMGEFGEAANKAKKLNRYRDGIPGNIESEDDLRAGLADEIADTVIYLDLLAQAAGLDLAEAIVSKFNRTSEKIGAPHRLPAAEIIASEAEAPTPVAPTIRPLPTDLRQLASFLLSTVISGEELTAAEKRDAYGIIKETQTLNSSAECVCEGEFIRACGPECGCLHHDEMSLERTDRVPSSL